MKVGQLITVEWRDAFVASSYWTTIDELSEIKSIVSTGYYLKQSKNYLTIAQSSGRGRDDELDGFGGAFSIPIGTIRSITKP